jgi:hypothetical protein
MKRLGLVLFAPALALVAGCGGSPKAASLPKPVNEGELPAELALTPTRFALVQPAGKLRVGDTADVAQFLFPAPPKADPVETLPFHMGDNYSAMGWEKGDDGFAAVLHRDKVALALKTSMVRSEQEVAAVVQAAEQEAGEAPIRAILYNHARFWFWRQGVQRQMVSATRIGPDRYKIAVAIGHVAVMDRLGMEEGQAQKDAQEADRIFKTRSANRSAG